jgi:hypothetical protein
MKLTHYPFAPFCPIASPLLLSPDPDAPDIKQSIPTTYRHPHDLMSHDRTPSLIAKPNYTNITTMKDLTRSSITNLMRNPLASVRMGIATLFIFASLFMAGDAFGQITQVGASTTANISGSTITIDKPTGIQVGDVMLANLVQSEASGGTDLDVNITSPGWTNIDGRLLGGTDPEYWGTILYKIAVLADVSATNYVFTLDGDANGGVGTIVAFRNVDLTGGVTETGGVGGIFDVDPGIINGLATDNSLSATSITTTSANAAIIMFGLMGDNDNNDVTGWTTTSPGTLTELYENETSSGDDQSVAAAWAIKTAAGATGNGSATLANSNINGSLLIALKGVCIVPTVPTITASPDPFCPGQSVTLTISGTLNGAGYWAIYTGSCGGTLVGTTATNAFVVNPSATTTYYVRGEGSCVTTPGSCGQVVVDLDPNVPGCTTPVLPGDNAIDVSLLTNLDWQATTCVTGYKIYFGTNFPPTNIENGTNLGNVLSYNPASLSPNTVYNWRIVPYNANGDAVGCEDWQFTTGDGTPDCTTPVFPFNGSTGLNPAGINLQWAADPQATGYVLFFGTNNPPTNIVNGTNLGNVTTYATGALSMGQTYYWRIRPQNSFGNAGTCDVWSFTTDLDGIMFCDDCTDPAVLPECADPGTNNNPDLSANCAEISIAFVLDESGSVSGNQADVENGTMNLLSSLSCTGASVAMIEFNGYARYLVSDYEYVDDAYVTAAQNYFDDIAVPFMGNEIYEPGGYPSNDQGTNWQAALHAVDELPFAPDLVIFLTDGIPTGYSTGANPTYNGPFDYCTSGSSTQVPEIVNPIKLTNKLKGEGSHIFVVGVGNVTVASIEEISGTTVFSNGVNNIGNSDYAIGSFAQLSNGLAALVADLCPFDSDVTSADICEGSSNGSIFISVPSNLVPFNYEYYRNNVFVGSGNNINTTPFEISGLIAGNYRVEVEVTLPGSGCTRTEIFFDTINTGAPLLVSSVTSTSNPTCLDPNAGSATLTVTVGPPPYVIMLKKAGVPQPGFPDTTIVNPYIVTGLDFGNYTLEVYNVDSCNIDINPFTLTEPTNCCPTTCTITGGPGGNVCPNTQASFGATADNCTSPSYSWAIINNNTNATISGPTTNPTVTVNSGTTCGTYTIQSTLTCSGCDPVVCTQVVNVVDITDPVITTCAVTRNIEGCNTAAITDPPFSATSATSSEGDFEGAPNNGSISDACGIESVTYIDVAVGTCPIVVTRTWTITDACGNDVTCNQTINVDDTVNPTITTCAVTRNIEGCGPSAITGPAYSTVSAASTEAVFENGTNQGVASDACGITSVTYIDVAVGTCPVVVTRTWTISDACGNTSTCNQIINVDDNTVPVINCPSNLVLECSTGANYVAQINAWIATATASDLCDMSVAITTDYNGVNVPPLSCTQSIGLVVVFTATDDCGNIATCSRTIYLDDSVAPVITTCPMERDIEGCGTDDITSPAFSTTTAASSLGEFQGAPNGGATSDACGITSVTYIDVAVGMCPIVVSRTWTITDGCGNTNTCVQTINVDDTTPPVLAAAPANVTVDCLEDVPAMTNLSWTDNCGGSGSVAGVDGPLVGGECGGTITRTWNVMDACGNAAITTYTDDNSG